MADSPYGVYVSLRDPNTGALVSVNRPNWDEAEADLTGIMGEDFTTVLISGLRSNFKELRIEVDEGAAVENLQSMLGATPAPTETVIDMQGDTPAFDACEKCGTLKDKWNPPGVSRNGKRYQGFYGCPNFRNH